MSKIAGELNAEMMGTINSSTYQAWINSPLTKAIKKSFEQSITDPENQPSQYGTVTLEYMQKEIESMIAKTGEVMRERAISKMTDIAPWEHRMDKIRAITTVTIDDMK